MGACNSSTALYRLESRRSSMSSPLQSPSSSAGNSRSSKSSNSRKSGLIGKKVESNPMGLSLDFPADSYLDDEFQDEDSFLRKKQRRHSKGPVLDKRDLMRLHYIPDSAYQDRSFLQSPLVPRYKSTVMIQTHSPLGKKKRDSMEPYRPGRGFPSEASSLHDAE